MAAGYGVINFADNATSVNTLNQRAIYDLTNQALQLHTEALVDLAGIFVEKETEESQVLYKLPGTGFLQRRGGQEQSHAVRPWGEYQVGFPLEEWGDQIAGDRVSLAYLTVEQYNLFIQTVQTHDARTLVSQILKRIFNNAQFTYRDRELGPITVYPLANGDATTYPPYPGADTEAIDNMYLVSGYAAASISDVNNPFPTIKGKFKRWGSQAAGTNLIAFNNSAQSAKISDLTDFVDIQDLNIRPGINTEIPIGVPRVPREASVYGRVNGVWVAEWDRIPANYIYTQKPDLAAPLWMRRDPARTGLPRGLTLVSENEYYPLRQSHFENRFGLGTANRLNGCVMYLATGSTYVVPGIPG